MRVGVSKREGWAFSVPNLAPVNLLSLRLCSPTFPGFCFQGRHPWAGVLDARATVSSKAMALKSVGAALVDNLAQFFFLHIFQCLSFAVQCLESFDHGFSHALMRFL